MTSDFHKERRSRTSGDNQKYLENHCNKGFFAVFGGKDEGALKGAAPPKKKDFSCKKRVFLV
jgi:hypothetical protein